MLQPLKYGKVLGRLRFRNYHKKKKLPADQEDAENFPVQDYVIKSSDRPVVFAWGAAEHGALGHYFQKKRKMSGRFDPKFRTSNRPFRHGFGEFRDVTDIAAGFGFSAFSVKTSNRDKIWGAGINTDSQIGYQESRRDNPLGIILAPVPINLNLKNSNTKVISISAGRAHLAIATDKEGVFTLGNNSYGQCGRKIIENEKYVGSRVVHNIPTVGDEKVESVECGQDHTLFLTENGNVYSCGWSADGQTGLGHYEMEAYPKRVLGDIEGEKIIKLSAKSDCVLAINDKGDVFGWGNSEYSQIFDETATVQQINKPILLKKCQGFGKIIDIAAAGSYCMMLNEDGKVYSWGYGILGRGPDVSQSWTPRLIPPILFGKNDFQVDCKVVKIYCGLNFSAAINSYGHIYTWGKNKGGCLGLGHFNDQFFPFRVCLGAFAKKLALGVDHALAICNPF